MDFETLLTWNNLIAFLTLTSLEIVLGIDNIIFIAILAGKLPPEQRDKARRIGLAVAVISRIALLLGIGWVIKLKEPLFHLLEHEVTGKDLTMIIGGLFLMAKATWEIHHKVKGLTEHHAADTGKSSLMAMLFQVMLIDVVFSLDSVITAVGMCKEISIMIAAILCSVGVMLWFSGAIVRFVDQHPAIKILALSFLLLIGVLLVGEGMGKEIPKSYVYFAMAYALGVELLQMAAEANTKQVANDD